MAMRKSSIILLFNQYKSQYATNIQSIYKSQLNSCRGLQTKSLEKEESKPNKNEKLVKVAIIGSPNAGKSTFINKLLNHRICATSQKVHTTSVRTKAIGIRNNAQVILFDTPGLVTEKEMKKYKLSSEFISSPRHSIQHSDLIGVVHDVSNTWTRNELHSNVLNTLEEYSHLPSFLILNKIDVLKSKRLLLDLVRTVTLGTVCPKGLWRPKKFVMEMNEEEKKQGKIVGWPGFSAVFMISSLYGDGMEDVMKFLLRHAKDKKWEYGKEDFTDLPPEELVVQSVRARLLDYLPQEIPYSLKCNIEFFSIYKGTLMTSVQVTCPSERIERLISGVANERLKQITEHVTSDLVETFARPVSLTIILKSKPKPESPPSRKFRTFNKQDKDTTMA